MAKAKTLKSARKPGIGQYILCLLLLLYTAFCALPILLVIISAFTSEKEIGETGFTYFPKQWSFSGMNAVLRYGEQLRAGVLPEDRRTLR